MPYVSDITPANSQSRKTHSLYSKQLQFCIAEKIFRTPGDSASRTESMTCLCLVCQPNGVNKMRLSILVPGLQPWNATHWRLLPPARTREAGASRAACSEAGASEQGHQFRPREVLGSLEKQLSDMK